MMNLTRQAILHGAGALSGPKDSFFNAIADAMTQPSLTAVFIDTNDGTLHVVGSEIRIIAARFEYKIHRESLTARGRTRD
jgi:hypothetical protein